MIADVLLAQLGDGVVTTDPDVLAAYGSDYAPFCPTGTAAVLVRARSTDDVVTTMRAAHEARVPVVPQGARSGLSGGANAVDGCVLLSLERMNRILDVDAGEQLAVVQPGVVNAVLSRTVAEQGLFYPPDPASWEFSTIGGNVATNAGGLCCVKYGVTGDAVRALEVVLADGSLLHTGRRTAKGVAGYDLTHLFVGSEGTLGVVTEVTVALRPAPAPSLTAAATFADVTDACRAVNDVMASGLRPSLLELMDAASIEVVSTHRDLGFGADVGALLIMQSDVAGSELEAFADACRRHRSIDVVVAESPEEGELLVEARRLIGPALEGLGLGLLVEDVCVPRRQLAPLVSGVADIARELNVRIPVNGHAGDGNMHPVVVFDATDVDATRRGQAAFEAILKLGLDLGGTITGEHGVGVLKRAWLETELGAVSTRAQLAVKNALDPFGILNPGKMLPF
ncbi:FAD-binding oxidoreductase [Cryptosporangium sp. NPDC048952]|uniref:FAD-binding oxidoreductase n=1 Tax=Cryptosporangium sp. NPDC048952 TaxID=3363961 RepID=UPI0037149EC4